ncbi:MAG TPA: hypothetical protein VF048_10370, partial [Gemmatimonadaceae bacterium]
MSCVCLWIPGSPTGAAASADAPPHTGATPGDRASSRSALVATLLAVAPHVAVETRGEGSGTRYWVDARGLPVRRVARAVLRLAREAGAADARVGVAGTAAAAELAATAAPDTPRPDGEPPITVVPPGTDASFLAPLPLAALAAALVGDGEGGVGAAAVTTLVAALRDVGLETCGDLAQLTRAAVELRFGAPGVALWRLARADATLRTRQPLALFPPRPR